MTLSERVSSGIPGLDELIQGGFVKNSVNLITGETGTGKTIFGLQYIWDGLQKGENGVFLSLDQEPENILADVKQFGWDFESYIKKGKCIIEYLPSWKLEELPVVISEKVEAINAKRFVLDSLTLVCSSLDSATIRSEMSEFIKELRHLNLTSLLISEIPEDSKSLSRFGIEEFIVDGIIVLHYLEFVVGKSPRSLIIRKMRRTNHGVDIYPLKITNKGLVVG